MTKTEILAKFEELKAASSAATAQARVNRTPETMRTAVDASGAQSDFMAQHPFLMPKAAGNGSRAGQRQAKEREAQRQEALRRQGRRA